MGPGDAVQVVTYRPSSNCGGQTREECVPAWRIFFLIARIRFMGAPSARKNKTGAGPGLDARADHDSVLAGLLRSPDHDVC
jgi:hypothetical protein